MTSRTLKINIFGRSVNPRQPSKDATGLREMIAAGASEGITSPVCSSLFYSAYQVDWYISLLPLKHLNGYGVSFQTL
jgi:hypothetical protein